MTHQNEVQPFVDLPEALVEEMLSKCDHLGKSLSSSFQRISERKSDFRVKLSDDNLLKKDTEISSFPQNPTSCGIDGSYAVERLLSTDIAATAALAIEGLTPPTEKRYWPTPRHRCEIFSVPHYDSTISILRAIMMCMELELAIEAPHDIVMIDGSFTTPLIYINQALDAGEECSKELHDLLYSKINDSIDAINIILESKRSDKIFLAMPKYTTKKELSDEILNLGQFEDRGLLSFILEAGEYVGPIPKGATSSPYNIEKISEQYSGFVSSYLQKISNLRVIYYRPFDHLPALRIEISNSIARNNQRLSALFEALRIQCGSPSIFEPYPLYMADRMIKHLGRALPALRRTTTQYITDRWEDSLGSIFLAMHGYRTEWG